MSWNIRVSSQSTGPLWNRHEHAMSVVQKFIGDQNLRVRKPAA